ncbi:hypothetical protein Vqi01_40540 [Micromonospora qiuiae]|uniref:Hsp70 family protein n=1 Tax=Micromonospora qiuiae TaxID=502268 RepID=A0ABQ4JFB1_9ACTN|nr:hypothetical protein Vqi01_40540 [Micromonospora qiuiae]
MVTGQRAWQAAAADPQRFVPRPRRPADEQVSVAGEQVAPADLVAATLRRVVDEAYRVAGDAVEDVRLVVPAGWGPRRRTWLRHAAHRAGLPQPRLVEAPVAVASHALAGGVQVPVGSVVVVVCDLGGGAEVSVLRRSPVGFEVLSTLADPDAGGDAIDAALTAALVPEGMPVGEGWALAASLRTAKHALAGHPAVTVPVPSGPAVVLNHLVVEQAARPVLVRAAGLVRDAVAAAEVDPATVAGLWCVGGTAQMPLVADVMVAESGLRPMLVPDPLLAAARGAADAGGFDAGQATPAGEPVPTLWRALAIAVPGFASLALVSHMLFTAEWEIAGYTRWAFLNWGELAMASVFAVLACLAAGTVLGSALAARTDSGVPLSPGAQVATGILTSAWLGVAVVGMYAVVGSQYIGTELGAFLRWTLVPVIPTLLVAMVLALIAFRQWRTPRRGWSEFLAFPISSVMTAAAGMMLVQWSLPASYPPHMITWMNLGARVGGLLIGIGVITALVSGLWMRLVMGVPFAILTATLVHRHNTGTVAGLYVVATVWWLARLWTRILYSAPASTHPRRSLLPPGPPRS